MISKDNDKGKVLSKRVSIIATVIFVIMLIIIFRLYYLQVFQADRYKMLADKNRISTRIIIPHRGLIYDRNMTPLAINQQNFQALIVAEQTPNIDETLIAFNNIMPLSDTEIERIKKEIKKNKSFVPIKVKDNLSWDEMAKIQLHSSDLMGIYIDEGLLRHYPYEDLTAHVLGYVSYATPNDIKQSDDPLLKVPDFRIGREGIEKTFEKKLRGKGGSLKLEVNAFGRIMQEINRIDSVSGDDIILSIDVRLHQKAAELFGNESGAVVLLDVNNGEILAFSSFPSFDPNLFIRGFSQETWSELEKDEKKPFSNKAILEYSPGSTFKMVVALAAMEQSIVNTQSTSFCSGKMSLGNHTFHCWKRQGHSHVALPQALQHSCDIFFYETALKLGVDNIANMANRFGLGKKTSTEISGEKIGLIPTREWKQKTYKEPWQQGESMIVGIGQSYVRTTPIQLAKMTAMIANDGYEVTPTFIKSENDINVGNRLNIPLSFFPPIKKGMYDVMNTPGGTAYVSGFNYKGKRMGGKTGTTQVRRISMKERMSGVIKQEDLPWKYRNHALFVGYAPHDNPKYAVAVIVEHGGSGSTKAAPIGAKLLEEALKLDDNDALEIITNDK